MQVRQNGLMGRCRRRWPYLSVPVVAVVVLGGRTVSSAEVGDGRPMPPIRHAERLTYDPKTDQWVRTAEPIPGTEDGDLDIARQGLARADYQGALKQVKQWIKTYGPSSGRYPEALFLQASSQLECGDYQAARESYEILLNDFPGSPYAEPALSGLFRIGEQYLAGKRRKAWKGLLRIRDRDGGVKIMDDLVTNYRDTPLAEAAQRTKADYYYARGEFESAEEEYATFARQYPRSRWHPLALLQSARSALASFPGVKFDDAALIEAQERFGQFQQLYPGPAGDLEVPVILEQIAARRGDKTFEIARFYEKTGHPGAARYYYRATVQRWPGTPAAAQAAGRLASLGEPVSPIGGQAYAGPLETSQTGDAAKELVGGQPAQSGGP